MPMWRMGVTDDFIGDAKILENRIRKIAPLESFTLGEEIVQSVLTDKLLEPSHHESGHQSRSAGSPLGEHFPHINPQHQSYRFDAQSLRTIATDYPQVVEHKRQSSFRRQGE